MSKRFTQEQIDYILREYQAGKSGEVLAKELETFSATIGKILKKNGVQARPIKKKKDQNEILKICQEYQDGYSTYELGEKYGLSFATINNYLKENNIARRDMSECHRIYEINEDFFDVIDCEEKAYMLGWMYSDGCNQQESNAIRLAVHPKDIDILQKFSKLIFKDNPESHIKFSERTEKRYDKNIAKTYDLNYLNIHSKHMCTSLAANGCPERKTFIIRYPSFLSLDLQRHFIRGEMDGDGSITVAAGSGTKKIYAFKITGTLDLCQGIAEILKNTLNVGSSISKCSNSDVYNVSVQGSRQVETVLDWLYNPATIWLDRKYNKYLELKEKIIEINKTFKEGGYHHDKYVLKK